MDKLIKILLVLFLSNTYASVEEDIKSRIVLAVPEVKITEVSKTPVKGIYLVKTHNDIIYASESGRYIFVQSQMLDLDKNRDDWNLTEEALVESRKPLLKQLKNEDLIVFGDKKSKASVVVFTDYTCGYCRKFHKEVDDLNKLGIEVKYAAFPRAGIGSDTYNKTVAIWCANNRNEAIASAKLGKEFSSDKCDDNPVSMHYQLGQKLGVRGTPALLLEDGTLIPGYMPAEQLAQKIFKK